MKKVFPYTIIFIVNIFFPFNSYSQWTTDVSINTPVCTATDDQIENRIMEDGTGGAFIVWRDYRNGAPDIFVQRLNKDGIALWTLNGVGACTYSADQSTPSIVSDLHGGCIIAWSDWRSSIERDLYAQRIDSNGNMLWTLDGVVVTNKPEREHSERMCSDGAGGAIVAWEQQSNVDFSWGVWCQRIDSNGVNVWPSGGMPVCNATGQRRNERIQGDGKGGAFITFQDFRNGNDYDIYAQHVSAIGQRLWGNNAIAICTAPGVQNDPKIDPEPSIGGCFVVWIDKRNGTDYDIYAQKIDSMGICQWANNGVPVVTAQGSQTAQDFCSNGGVPGFMVTWKDSRGSNYDIYAQLIGRDGTPKWNTNGIPVCNALDDQLNPNIVPDGSGGGIIVWQDSRGNNWDIAAQRIDSLGNELWTNNGVQVSVAPSNQTAPKHCSDGNGGTIVCFQDTRNAGIDIYAQHIFANGSPNSINLVNKGCDLKIYPNPFSDFISVQNSYMFSHYTMTDITGKIIFEGNEIGSTDFSTIPSGIYFLEITIATSQLKKVVKLIKE